MDPAKTPLPQWVRIPKTVKPDMLLKPHFQDRIHDISKPHKFESTHLEERANRDAQDSRGQPLLYAFCYKKKPNALKAKRYLDDFKKVKSYITDLTVQWHFSQVQRESLTTWMA
eukprot:jgi/Tetstr1/459072/TSEL_000408.t1